ATSERVARELQAGYLAVLLGFILYYGIRIRHDVKGIMLGYALITSAGVLCLGAVALWEPAFNHSWVIIQPAVFCGAVVVWLQFLWGPTEEAALPQMEAEEYQRVHSRTTRAYARMADRLLHILRTE